MEECMEGCRMVAIADDLEQTITYQIWADNWDGEGSALLGESTRPYKTHHIEEVIWPESNENEK